MEDIVLRPFPEDYVDFPSSSNIGYIPATRDVDGKMFRLTLARISKEIGVISSGGSPLYFEGNQLPTNGNDGNPVKKGDWVILTEGVYTNINGGSDVVVDSGNLGLSFFDGESFSDPKEFTLPTDPNSVKKSDLEGGASSNIYNYQNDILNYYINNTGNIVYLTGGKMSTIDLEEGQEKITFSLKKDPAQNVNKYYVFQNDENESLGFGVANSNLTPNNPVTLDIPSGSTKVSFTTKNPNEADSTRISHMVNYGSEAFPFIPYDSLLVRVYDKYLTDYAKKSEVATPELIDEKISLLDIPSVENIEIISKNLLKSNKRFGNWYIGSTANQGLVFSNGWYVWIFPISEIKKMTVSGWLSARTELGFFNGTMPSVLTGSTNSQLIRSGTLGQLGIPAKVNGVTTFTPPEGATWGAITAKRDTEATTVFANLQIEYGESATPYQSGDDVVNIVSKIDSNEISSRYLKDANGNLVTLEDISKQIAPDSESKINISRNGLYLNIEYDLFEGKANQRMLAFRDISLDYPNVVDFNDFIFDGNTIHTQSDVVAPIRMEGATIGANHGYFKTRITVPSHGKTNLDVGSVWNDGTDECVIVNVYDGNNLDVSYRYSNVQLLVGTVLNHVSGATNTATMNVSSKLGMQMYPCLKDRVLKFYCDGKEVDFNEVTEASADKEFIITDSYSLLRKSSIMEWLISRVGTSSKIVQYDGLAIARVSYSYKFKGDGNVIMNLSFLELEDTPTFQDIMFNMNNRLNPQSNIKYYVPGTLEFTQSGTTYNFTNPTEMPASIPVRLNFNSLRIDPERKYPSRVVQVTDDWCFSLGFLPLYDADDLNRPLKASRKALQFSENIKTYMSAIDSDSITSLQKGDYFSVVGFKSYFRKTNETANYFVEDEDICMWYLDFHELGSKIIKVPSELIGRSFEVYDKTDNLTLYSKQLTSEITLDIDNTSNYAYIVLKINK